MTLDWLIQRLLHDVTSALCVADYEVVGKIIRPKNDIVRARAIFYWLLIEMTGERYAAISQLLGVELTTVRAGYLKMCQALDGTLARPTTCTRPAGYYTFGLRLVLEQAKISARILGTPIEPEEATT